MLELQEDTNQILMTSIEDLQVMIRNIRTKTTKIEDLIETMKIQKTDLEVIGEATLEKDQTKVRDKKPRDDSLRITETRTGVIPGSIPLRMLEMTPGKTGTKVAGAAVQNLRVEVFQEIFLA